MINTRLQVKTKLQSFSRKFTSKGIKYYGIADCLLAADISVNKIIGLIIKEEEDELTE